MSSPTESTDDLSSMNGIPFTNYLLPLRLMTEEEEHQVRVEFFTNERSIKERLQLYFIKNQRSSLRIRLFNFSIKILTCLLYIIRVAMDDPTKSEGCQCPQLCNYTRLDRPIEDYTKVQWELILYVNRTDALWVIQVVVAVISLTQSCLITYLGYKGNIAYSLLAPSFLLECLNSVPFLVTTFNSKTLKCLFIPVFLNCWLAKKQLEDMFGDLNRVLQRNSTNLSHRVMKVISTTFCLIFTSVCGMQHLQRGGYKHLTLFESLWYVVVTFSTVGYGDYRPDIWPSQIFMIIMIVVGITVLPAQLEKLAYAWMERHKLGATYSRHRAKTEKHVVVCTTALHSDTIMDFLNEFYAHPKLQDYYVCLLSPCELDSTMKMILQVPIWAERVIFIQGSALKDIDLARCRMQDAEACFILAPNNYQDRNAADQHTIMRSWAVKDFAPQCPQYVQLYRPENKFHVIFAEHVVCEDEFKYALLANNSLIPGISTLVTLLLHTSRGQEGQSSSESWQRLYGKCSGNEVYHIQLGSSQFFKEYDGKPFTFASFHAHRKYGVSLVAISSDSGIIQLNPGPRHLLKSTDICFYLSITKEENSTFKLTNCNDSKKLIKNNSTIITNQNNKIKTINEKSKSESDSKTSNEMITKEASLKLIVPNSNKHNMTSHGSFQRSPRGSIAPVPDYYHDFFIKIESVDEPDDIRDDYEEINCIKGCPPVLPYIGTAPCLCHLMREKRHLCCLQLVESCAHCPYENVNEYRWRTRSVIVYADYAGYGLFNFIVPLRSHWRSKKSLKPIILILEKPPDDYFLEAISYFPLIYWMLGSIESLDDLLKAGIILADNVVIVNKESSNSAEEETLADCNTIVAVQTIYRLFPHVRIITELSRSSNMRFTLFSPDDKYALNMSKVEKKERARGSHISYIFRLPFAAGNVFSASMLDTLLYQAFVKSYLIKFVRLLLGIDQAVGSGHLTCCHIKEEDLWIKTYGRLYQKLCSSTCEIPIGLYRTIKREKTDFSTSVSINDFDVSFNKREEINLEKVEISQMIKCRLLNLGMGIEDYENFNLNEKDDKYHSLSFVITNPSHDLPLEQGDIVYLLRPSSLSDKASPLIDERKTLELKKCRSSLSMLDADRVKSNKYHSLLNISGGNGTTINTNTNSLRHGNYPLDRKSSQSLYGGGPRHGTISRQRSPHRKKFYLDTPQASVDKYLRNIETNQVFFESVSCEKISEDAAVI